VASSSSGNVTNPKRIANALSSGGQPTTNHTVASYIAALAVTRDSLGDVQMHHYQVALSVRDSQTR